MESEAFRRQLANLGIERGDTVLVHASMRALGTARRPEAVLEDLEAAVGPAGTLLLPALTYDVVTPERPVFDSEKTEPCVGLLPRTFWRMPGVVRSENPTHSVCAWGRLAHRLTVGHAMDDTAVGPHSPFMLLPLYQGKLLFIGDILHACTFMHGIEEIVRPPYITRVRQTYRVNGRLRSYEACEAYGWGSEFQRVETLLEAPDLKKGRLGAANAYLLDTRALLAAALSAMRAEPYRFVTDISSYI